MVYAFSPRELKRNFLFPDAAVASKVRTRSICQFSIPTELGTQRHKSPGKKMKVTGRCVAKTLQEDIWVTRIPRPALMAPGKSKALT